MRKFIAFLKSSWDRLLTWAAQSRVIRRKRELRASPFLPETFFFGWERLKHIHSAAPVSALTALFIAGIAPLVTIVRSNEHLSAVVSLRFVLVAACLAFFGLLLWIFSIVTTSMRIPPQIATYKTQEEWLDKCKAISPPEEWEENLPAKREEWAKADRDKSTAARRFSAALVLSAVLVMASAGLLISSQLAVLTLALFSQGAGS
jgi:hypothetical protein